MALPNPMMPFILRVSQSASVVPNERTRRICIVSAGDTSIGDSEYKVLDANNWSKTITREDSEAGKFAKTFFAQEGAEFKSLIVFEVTSSGNAEDRLKKLEAFIDGGTYPCWAFAMPNALVNDAYFGTLATKYDTSTSQTYFIVTLDDMPDSSAFFNTYVKGHKSCFACYPNQSDTNLSVAGAFAGCIASNKYDISSATPMSPLSLKRTTLKSKVLASADITALTDAPTNYLGVVSGADCLLNGFFCDLHPFEFWYAFDTVCNKLVSEMNAFAVNSVNINGASLKYNNTGIKTARDKIISILEVCQSFGLINKFGSSKDLATEQILDEGSIGWVDADIYRKANPADYQGGIYAGFTCYVDIQGFIKQIPLNIAF